MRIIGSLKVQKVFKHVFSESSTDSFVQPKKKRNRTSQIKKVPTKEKKVRIRNQDK